ncbi:MAG: hypothetical protein JWR37_1005 [Mycobacterium sp.]|jgi:hypothetical protein|nr:hypothetical protein [Mycobacterium sp.]
MTTELQYFAIAAFLLWGLLSSVCGFIRPDSPAPEPRLIWREWSADGWIGWREVHFGLARAHRRFLHDPEPAPDSAAYAALLDTVMQQSRQWERSAVQFAIVRLPADGSQPEVMFVSGVHDAAVRSSDRAA